MRTTLTLDTDVAAHLDRLRTDSKKSFKVLVNEALREGLTRIEADHSQRGGPFTRPTFLGQHRLPDVDDVSETLAVAEGDAHR